MLFNSFSSAYVGGVRFARIFLLLFAVNASSDIRILYEVHFNQYIQNHRWNLSGFLTTGIVVPVPSMSKTRACARRCMENQYVTSMRVSKLSRIDLTRKEEIIQIDNNTVHSVSVLPSSSPSYWKFLLVYLIKSSKGRLEVLNICNFSYNVCWRNVCRRKVCRQSVCWQ